MVDGLEVCSSSNCCGSCSCCCSSNSCCHRSTSGVHTLVSVTTMRQANGQRVRSGLTMLLRKMLTLTLYLSSPAELVGHLFTASRTNSLV